MVTRHSVDYNEEEERMLQVLMMQSEYDSVKQYFKHLIRKEAKRENVSDDVGLDDLISNEDDTNDIIQYDPDGYDARYTLDKNEIKQIIEDYDHPAIDPSHLPADLPQEKRLKGEIAAACYRYRLSADPVTESHISRVVRVSVGAGSQGRLLEDRVEAAMNAFYELEIDKTALYGDNVTRDLIDDVIWQMWDTDGVDTFVYESVDELVDRCERMVDAGVYEEVEKLIEQVEVVIDVAKEHDRDDVVDQADEMREMMVAYIDEEAQDEAEVQDDEE